DPTPAVRELAARAIVSTRIGAAGLPVRGGEELLLADDTPSFAAAVVETKRWQGGSVKPPRPAGAGTSDGPPSPSSSRHSATGSRGRLSVAAVTLHDSLRAAQVRSRVFSASLTSS